VERKTKVFDQFSGSSSKASPKEEEPKSVVKDESAENVADANVENSPTNETSASIVNSSSSFFSSAWNKVGEITK
jgi:hypothetical protein